MAEYKVVNITQLEEDLTTVANTIREKNRVTGELAFPGGFTSAVENIPDYLELRLNGTLSEYHNSKVTKIYASAFSGCRSLSQVSFPACTTIGGRAFYSCTSLASVSFPACTTIGEYAFSGCRSLSQVSFPACTTIGGYAFRSCYKLSEVYLLAGEVCRISGSNVFLSTPFTKYSSYFSGMPFIYVPSVLLSSYLTATNWVYFSSYISGIEYEVDIIETITFKIGSDEFVAEKDMTWLEWISSDYNPVHPWYAEEKTFKVFTDSEGGYIYHSQYYYRIAYNDGADVIPSDKIQSGYEYIQGDVA